MSKDWTGNTHSTFVTLGASNHTNKERDPNDFYATEPKATELLLQEETFSKYIWEPACGLGHISEVLKKNDYKVLSTDKIHRGYEDYTMDFFDFTDNDKDIITNPPYKIAKEFIEHALDISNGGVKIAMFLKLTFLESKKRRELFEKYPFKTLYVSSSRLNCAMNGDFDKYKSSAAAYGWYIWVKGFDGIPQIKWIN